MKRFCLLATICLFLCLSIINGIDTPVCAEGFESCASSMILMEQTTGRVLAEKNADQQRSIASTTKILTCLTVLENCQDLERIVKINKNYVGVEGTSIYLKEGENLTVKDLLYGLMLRSGNDAATALAYEIAGDIPSFARLMNQTAKKYGAQNCNFENPHGLESANHHCSARELANITRHALSNEKFAEIVSAKSYKVQTRENSTPRSFQNKNKLLFRFDGATGVKTGFTKKAGRCLVSSAQRNGLKLVCVVLNCGPMFEESEQLFEDAFNKYSMRELVEPYSTCGMVDVIKGEVEEVEVFTMKGFSYPLSEEEYQQVKIEYDYPSSIQAPLKKESIIGKVKIKLNNDLLFEENVYTIKEVKSPLIKSGIKDFIDKWF